MPVGYALRVAQIAIENWALIRNVLWGLGGILVGIPFASFVGRWLQSMASQKEEIDRHRAHELEMNARAEDIAHADGLTAWDWAKNIGWAYLLRHEQGLKGLQQAAWDIQSFRDNEARPAHAQAAQGIASLSGSVNVLEHHISKELDPAVAGVQAGVGGLQSDIWSLRHHVETELDPTVIGLQTGVLGLQTSIQNLEATWNPARSTSLSQVETNVLVRPVEWIGSLAASLAPFLFPPLLPLWVKAMVEGSSDDPGYIGKPRIDP